MHIIKRGNTDILNLKATGTLTKRYMDASVVQMNFTLTDQFDFAIGDSVIVHGQRFYLNKIPLLTQQSSFKYDYVATFEARYYDLAKVIFCQYDENNELTEGSFSLMATAEVFLNLIVKNANRDQSGWEVGTVDNTEAKNLTFSANTKCLTALAQVAEAFELEYWEENQVLHLSKKGAASGLTLSYGKGKGFYNIARTNENDAAITTVVYARGGTQNIPNNYRNYSSRLKLPISAGIRLTANTELYGFNEEWLENNDIYPKRTGTVTAINGHLKFKDADIDFNINDQLLPGVSAKVTFQTGQLAGYELELTNYNHATKEFSLKVNADEKALEVPSALLHAVIGDKYVLHDIIMPESYILAAEQELYDWALSYLQKNSIPRVSVQPTADRLYFKKQAITLSLGDTASIVAPKLGINRELRILGYTQDINDPYNYTGLEFAETALPRAINRIVARAEKIDNAIRINNLLNPAKARNNWRTTQELTTMLDTLRAEMLLITVAGAAYDTNVVATVNADLFATTNGIIQHAEYTTNGGSWNVEASTHELNSNVAIYAYFKAAKSDNSASVVLSQTKIGVDDVDGFYHFPYGIISSVIDSTRVFTSTKGYTRITGDNVSTGKISSTNGTTVLDLDNGIFDIAGNAGISGNGALPASVRFWAGAAFADRNTAPFRVDHAGRLFATNATISGHIEATSGSIAGVNISAGDQFSLNGTKVKIVPDKGIRVLDGGYLTVPKTSAPVEDMPIGEYCLSINENVHGTTPIPVIANFGDMLNVDDSMRQDGWIVYWSLANGKYMLKASSGGPGPDVYSKSEINAFFGGASPITGYNKGNWDAAYSWGNHAAAGYAMANGSNAYGNWGVNAASADNWNLYASGEAVGSSIIMTSMGGADKWHYRTLANFKSDLGLNISVTAVPDTIVRRGSSGIIDATYYYMSGPAVDAVGIADFVTTAGDGYLRRSSIGTIKSYLGLPSSGGYDLQSVTDRGYNTSNPITFGNSDFVLKYSYTTGQEGFTIYRNQVGEFFIKNNGNVGFGTSSPMQKFVVSNGGALGFEIYDDSPNNRFGLQVYNRATAQYGNLELDAANISLRLLGGNLEVFSVGDTVTVPFRTNMDIIRSYLYVNNSGHIGFLNSIGQWKLKVEENGWATATSFVADSWFRSTGVSGWYNATYEGGIYMADSTYVRVYNGKTFLAENALFNQKMTAKHVEATTALRVPKVELDAADMVPGEYYLRIKEL